MLLLNLLQMEKKKMKVLWRDPRSHTFLEVIRIFNKYGRIIVFKFRLCAIFLPCQLSPSLEFPRMFHQASPPTQGRRHESPSDLGVVEQRRENNAVRASVSLV